MKYGVGIDISKGKSTIAIISVVGEVIEEPFEITHDIEGLNLLEEKGLFKKHTYNDIIDRMTDIIKYTTDTTKANWKLCNISKEDSELAMALGV